MLIHIVLPTVERSRSSTMWLLSSSRLIYFCEHTMCLVKLGYLGFWAEGPRRLSTPDFSVFHMRSCGWICSFCTQGTNFLHKADRAWTVIFSFEHKCYFYTIGVPLPDDVGLYLTKVCSISILYEKVRMGQNNMGRWLKTREHDVKAGTFSS